MNESSDAIVYRAATTGLGAGYEKGYSAGLDAVSGAVEHEELCQSLLSAYPIRECNCYRHDVIAAIDALREEKK